MGYHTNFIGSFLLDKKLKPAHREYLFAFSQTRRMIRNEKVANDFDDPVRIKANLPLGSEACYFVGAKGFSGQDKDNSIVNYNKPPKDQPSLWCQFIPSKDGKEIIWDQGEKFYNYIEWIKYLIIHFIEPWGYKLNGSVKWMGEDPRDVGIINIKDNQIEVINLSIFS